uniref:Tumor protein p53 inducible protein 13 n=2 Tax=Vombatus ursinus TaxID=29139 RepID=A0A4X2KJR7_VOMUR
MAAPRWPQLLRQPPLLLLLLLPALFCRAARGPRAVSLPLAPPRGLHPPPPRSSSAPGLGTEAGREEPGALSRVPASASSTFVLLAPPTRSSMSESGETESRGRQEEGAIPLGWDPEPRGRLGGMQGGWRAWTGGVGIPSRRVALALCFWGLQVSTELAQDRVRCPGELWPLPQEVSPRVVTKTWMGPGQGSNITFLYHPCVHPWLKLQFALLAHICVSQPRLIPYLGLTQQRPLVLVASGSSLEMARVEPAWVARWLKRRRRRGKRRAWPTPSSAPWLHWAEPTLGKDHLCPRGSVQALATAFALRSWRPPGEGIKSWGPEYTLGAKRRGLRAAVGSLPTAPATRAPPHSLGISPGEAGDTPMLAIAPRGGESNDSRPGHGSPGGCVCPGHPSPAPRAAPSRPARAPTPRTEEAAWAATALTFLLVLLTLATLCTRLHRNFRRGESIYWGPSMDGQDTVAAVLKRRLLAAGLRRPKRSRRRPLLPPGPDPVGGSLGPDGGGGDGDSSSD